jgi:hypothetical protein
MDYVFHELLFVVYKCGNLEHLFLELIYLGS